MVFYHILLKNYIYCQLLQHSQGLELTDNSNPSQHFFRSLWRSGLFTIQGIPSPRLASLAKCRYARHELFFFQGSLEITDVQGLSLERQSGLGVALVPLTIIILSHFQTHCNPFFTFFLDFFSWSVSLYKGVPQIIEKVSFFRSDSFFTYSGIELPHVVLKSPAEPSEP